MYVIHILHLVLTISELAISTCTESLKSPMIDSHGEFPSSDDQRVMHLRGLGAQSFSSLDYLGVRGQMEPSSSYENIHTVFSQSSLNSSESSLNGRGGEEEGSLQLSEDADFGGVRKRREFQRKTTSASSSWSSADQESIDYQEKQRQRQHQLLEMSKMKVSESDSSYQPKYVRRRSDTEISGSRLKVGRNRRRSLSDTEENVEGEEEEMRRARKRDPHRVDETTGDRELLGTACVSTNRFTLISPSTHTHTLTDTYTHTNTRTHAYTHTCTHVHTHTHHFKVR